MSDFHDEVYIVSINDGEDEQNLFDLHAAQDLFDDLVHDPADTYNTIKLIKYNFNTKEEAVLAAHDFTVTEDVLPNAIELADTSESEVNTEEVISYDQYTTLVYTTQAIANDMKYIHWNCCGKNFDAIHTLTEEYYNKLNSELDLFAELALELPGITLANPSNMANKIEWQCIDNTNKIDYNTALDFIRELLCKYTECLRMVYHEEYGVLDADVKAELDSIIRFWTKEVNYKNVRRRMGA
jgi:DNA-binding ferritin-like protein